MIRRRLKGIGVALITPFKEDGSLDYDALVRLAEYPVQNCVYLLCVSVKPYETTSFTASE